MDTRDGSFDAIVVGAGFAGLYMLYRLRALGLTARVYEAAAGVGGTWYWNRYPGARCDVESMEYSYSFSAEMEQEWEWTERFPSQPEILRYLNHVADRFDLRGQIQLETRVVSALFDEEEKQWRVKTEFGETVTTRFCIMAVGCLSIPKTPEVRGLQTFSGEWYHTGRWPHEEVDFKGERVGVIGTGASAIQAIPIIAEQALELTVFQRSPNFVLPAKNKPLAPMVQQRAKENYSELRRKARQSPVGVTIELPTQSALEVDEATRRETYHSTWDLGSIFAMPMSYVDIYTNKAANDTAADFIASRIGETVADAEVVRMLTPTDHPFGTKRPCLESGYYAAYNRSNVHLVDVRATPILEIFAHGVRTSDQKYQLDTLVFATGFDAMTGPLLSIDIRGRSSAPLRQKWANGPRSYLGIAVAGFPNLFTITGPGSPSVIGNMVVSIEQHIDWIADCISFLQNRGLKLIETTLDAENAWVEHVQEVASKTLYPMANSWYMGANIPGKPRVFMPYIGGIDRYRETCDSVAAKEYCGFDLSS